MVRAKFVVNYKSEDGKHIVLSPVYSGSEENKQFFEATPGGNIQLYVVNKDASDQFIVGHEYYIDFTKA